MKKFYTLVLFALLGMCLSETAMAALTTTIKWNEPDAVEIRLGGNSASKAVTIPAGSTSYEAVLDQEWGSAYVHPMPGYILVSATGTTADGTTTALKTDMWGNNYTTFDMSDYDGGVVELVLEKIVYDGQLEVYVVNGRKGITWTFGGTNREVTLATGANTVPFSTKFEQTVTINYGKNWEADEYYCKKNGSDLTATVSWGTVSYPDVDVADTDRFELKLSSQDDPEDVKYTVTLDYADEMAKSALTMVFNQTTYKSVTERESFVVSANDVVRFTFNTKDYVVAVKENGVAVSLPETGSNGTSTWTCSPITANTTVSISATEREYGNVDLQIGLTDAAGVVLRAGAIDGEVIDLAGVASVKETVSGVEYNVYTVSVNAKSPKVFIAPADGWWVKLSGYYSGSKFMESNVVDTTTGTVYVDVARISADCRMAVVLVGDTGKATLRDSNRQNYDLEEGYNVFDFDPDYQNPWTVAPALSQSETMAVYCNDAAVGLDDETLTYTGINGADGTVVYVFANVPVSARHTISVNIPAEAAATEVIRDRVARIAADAASFTVFDGAEIAVKAAPGYAVVVDGSKAVAEYGEDYATFEAVADHVIEVKAVPAAALNPAPENELTSIDEVTVYFPGATSAVRNAEMGDDELYFTNNRDYAAFQNVITETTVDGAPGFVISFGPTKPTHTGNYFLMIPDGFFVVDGIGCDEIYEMYTLVPGEVDKAYTVTPEGYLLADDYLTFALVFEETLNATYDRADGSLFSLTLAGEPLVYGEDFAVSCEYNYVMFNLSGDKVANKTGELVLTAPEGLIKLSGVDGPAISNSWTVIEPKEYAWNLTPDGAETVEELPCIIIEYPEAERAEIFNEYGVTLAETEYIANRYNVVGKIEAVEGAEHPTFKVTFDPAPDKEATYMFEVWDSTFLLDGCQPSARVNREYVVKFAEGIHGIVADGARITVVAIDGRVILRDADPAQFGALDKGIYIVNGKKS